MKKRETNWSRFVNYFNSFEVGELITRQQLILYTRIVSIHTIDTFRCCLAVNNVIAKTDKDGVYVKCHNLPESITFNEMMHRGYGKRPKDLTWRREPMYIQDPGISPDPLFKSTQKSVVDLI